MKEYIKWAILIIVLVPVVIYIVFYLAPFDGPPGF